MMRRRGDTETPRHVGQEQVFSPRRSLAASGGGVDDFIYGRHPVLEAFRAEKGPSVNKLWVQRGLSGGFIDELVRMAREKGVVFQWVDRERLNQMAGPVPHQGVVARVSPFHYADLAALLRTGSPSPLVLLDGVEDPHNLGAIVRSAAFFGAAGVVVPRWRSAGLSAAVAKAAAGALGKIPLVQVANLAQTLAELKERNYWVYGADARGVPCRASALHPPAALVLGAEGKGLHRLVRERCDELVAVAGTGAMESLNVSCAASVLLYEFCRRQQA